MNTNSNIDKKIILITTLAVYQTKFWIKVAKKIIEKNYNAVFLSFDDRSTELLANEDLDYYDIPSLAKKYLKNNDDVNFSSVFEKYNVENTNYWESHERITFSITDTKKLNKKFAGYLVSISDVCDELRQQNKDIVFVQELGGFLSVIASFFVARKFGFDHYFLEPAFFKGRLFSLKNRFGSPELIGNAEHDISSEVNSYIDEATSKHQIVIPKKDKHHYNRAINKVVNIKNIVRLAQKVIDKYVLRKHQEFGYIGKYMSLHIEMLINSFRMKNSYTSLNNLDDFIYFPFHVPGDVAITLRSPEYLDQLSLIEYLLRVAPQNLKVAVKEHPAMIGAIDAGRLKKLMKRYDNLYVIRPDTNNYTVLHKASIIVSINSKSGAEASMLGKPVIVLGDAFYKDSPLVVSLDNVKDLSGELLLLSKDKSEKSTEDIRKYFQIVWDYTYPGELYFNDSDNINTFCRTIESIIN